MFRSGCLSLFVTLTIVSITGATAPNVATEVGQAMQDRDYDAAIEAIDKALQDEKAPKDYLTYLKARAYHYLGKYDQAVRVCDDFQNAFPDSPWSRRVRFAKAVSLARMHGFDQAETIYREEAEYLLSGDRKEEIANIYLEFARSYFKPEDPDKKPDYDKALEFFQKALEVGPKPETRTEVELLVGQCLESLQKYDEAIDRYTKFIDAHSDHKLDIEARYRLGDCRLKKGDHVEARRTWQDLLAKHADAQSGRIPEATYNLALTYRIPEPPSREDLDLGVAALRTFITRYPDHKLASKAYLDIARSYQKHSRHEDAAVALAELLADARYEGREEVPEGRFLLGQCYQLQKNFDQALKTWSEYLAKHPAHKQWSEAQRLIVDTEYLVAAELRAAKKYAEARDRWKTFLARHPLDGRAAEILQLLGQMNYDQEKWQDAISDWRRLVSKYPKTDPASNGQFMLALTLEEKLGQFEEAIEEYKKVTWGPRQNQARARIARLTAKQMVIRTERIFRTSESPRIKLTTRNLEEVNVRAYRIDLETYFRKMHLATGVETLDVALIDPDANFEFKVPQYAKYKQLDSDLELSSALTGESDHGGVLVVTVSSDTLEATTMVLQSDLDIIVKSSRDEVFVFAENMRTGKPWSGVRLLISDGDEVLAEAKTGEDGVFQQSYEQLKSAEDVRVFAVTNGHSASNVVGLSGLDVAQGLTNKGYIYTDRAAYRPGQMVNVRGIVRRVAEDTYRIDEGKAFQLSVFDPRNRLVYQGEVKLNDFGTFHSHFVLPPASPQGSYRVLVSDRDKQQYQGAFAVHEYKLESVQLAIEGERQVYYRGEEIEGTISAKYYYGAPLVGREIRYRLADGRMHTAKTDDKGEVHFKLATRDRRETQVLPLVAELPEFNLSASRQFVLAAQEYSLSVTTVRPCYLSGESFEAIVKSINAEGKPTAQTLKLRVLERTRVEGRVGERLVETKEVQTDKEKGEARVTLTLTKGAEYILRAEGTDRFENPITGQHIVQISGDDDEVRLRILASKHTFKAGDEPQIDVHWREQPALALVTYQGARVLGYQLVELQRGTNKLTVPMAPELAPNFELAIAVMTDVPADSKNDSTKPRRFHAASSPFTVERDLIVKLNPLTPSSKKTVRPGESIDVEISTTDPQGRPVDAEVSLAMVEQSLVDRFGSPGPSIGPFFRGAQRQTAVRTTSSVTFKYQPNTKRIDARLLAEVERLAVEEEERERLSGLIDGDFDDALDVHVTDAPAAPALTRTLAPSGSAVTAANARPTDAGGSTARGRVAGFALGEQAQQLAAGGMGGMGLGRATTTLSRSGRLSSHAAFGEQREEGVERLAEKFYSYQSNERYAADRSWGIHASQSDAGQIVAQLNQNSSQAQSNGVTAITNGGAVLHYNLVDLQGERGEALLGELAASDAVLLPGLPSQETGYWNPAIRTGESGKATVSFTVPDRSTAWKLAAKGVTAATLAGEGEGSVVAEKNLFGELKLPLAFTDGDQADIVATVHSREAKEGKVSVTLKTTINGKTSEQTKTIDANPSGEKQVVFQTTLNRPEDRGDDAEVNVALELIVASGDQTDHFRRVLPLEPYGLPVFGTASGTATSNITAWVELPPDMPAGSQSMEIVIGPTLEQGLLDVLFGPALRCQILNRRVTASSDAALSDLMAAVALQELLTKTRDSEHPQAAAIDQRIRSSIGLLVSSQRDDGGWSWAGPGGGDSNRYASARSVWALMLAAKAGYTVPDETKTKAIDFLRGQVAQTTSADYESKAIVVHALAVAGQDDFPLANRLYRNRPALSTGALLHLAMALAEMRRAPMAEDVLRVAAERTLDESQPRRASQLSSLPWSHSPSELRALYALALQQVRPSDPKLQTLVDWLMAHRVGNRWSPDKATGPAMVAVCRWFARSKFETETYKLTVYVNKTRVKELQFDKDARTETIVVPASLLAKGRQRVNFELNGRGQFSYQCILEGFVAADHLKSTTDDWRVERFYEAAPLERDGKVIPRGFDVLRGGYSTFRNPLTQLPVGRRGHVTLRVRRLGIPADIPPENLEYLVITEPLPSGATVVEDSVKGGFEWFEPSPGAITFYVGNRRHISDISYDIHGFVPGEYRAAPPIIRDAYRPDRFAVHNAVALSVLPLGAESADEYRLTPRELYELGKWHFDRKEMRQASEHLNKLVSEWKLKADILKDATRLLLDSHLEIGPPHEVVRHFEVIKERWPDMEIPYEKILKIGAAYHNIGEYERAYLIFRATVESSFLTESQVAGFLQSQAELLRSVETMGNLLREYPPEPYVAAATFDLAQQVYAMAPKAKTDKKLREKNVTRVDLIRRAMGMLDGFLTAYPEDPGADQAGFSMATALLELEQYKPAIDACQRFIGRYPESQDLDSFWYTMGYCHFALGEHKQALDVCQKVSEMQRKDPETGRMVEAANRYRAIYILGQIYHSLGQAAKAIAEYSRVEDRFADAKEAILYFSRRSIGLPEVTTVPPGKSVEVELKFRNVASCVATVYRIDLMKFSLLKRNLSGITNINLAGIHPYHEAAIELGDGRDYRDRAHRLPLPLKDEGAYLVVCRGGDLHASGLVLITPLKVDIQEDVPSGRVRTTVKDTTKESYVSDVHVKVIGSGNPDFVSGETDLRGVYIADGIQGESTVIAQAEGALYAFYRGTTHLGPRPTPRAPTRGAQQQAAGAPEQAKTPAGNELLEGLYLRNTVIQGENLRRQQEQYFNKKAGVTVEAVK